VPPVESYSVNFANGNLRPHWNSYLWDAMKEGESSPDDSPNSWGDYAGLNLTISRAITTSLDATTGRPPATKSVYLIPPPGVVTLDNRLMMRVEFDLPLAEPWVASPADKRATLQPFAGDSTGPEPWAVALNVKFGYENDRTTDRAVTVTCQFSRDDDGVRLNTPGSLQKGERAGCLDSPLDYAKYQARRDSEILDKLYPPKRFILEHAFCGYGAAAAANGHTPGSGSLIIRQAGWFPEPDKTDHRVYSSSALSAVGEPETSIGALGVSLVTAIGVGRLTVRLRTFTLFFMSSA
jgi:hypothetical protein